MLQSRLLNRHLARFGYCEGSKDINLRLNLSKSEIITQDHLTPGTLSASFLDIWEVDSTQSTFLAFPLGDGRCMSRAISEKTDAIKVVGAKFVALSTHDALLLLENSFIIPKVQFLISGALCFRPESLVKYDNTL